MIGDYHAHQRAIAEAFEPGPDRAIQGEARMMSTSGSGSKYDEGEA
jgi:hypothetical protein